MKALARILILFIGFLCGTAHCYEGKLFSLAVGAKLSNDVVRRGARLYDGVQASPVLYLGLFDNRVQFLVNSLEFTDFVYADMIRARTKINAVSDRPFLKTSGPLTARNARESSWEWTTRVEAFIPNFKEDWGQLDIAYAKDIKAHAGHYLEIVGRVTLARFYLENDRPLIQPQAFAAIGWGDGRHNEYLYGSRRQSGFNHVAYGLMLVSPSRIDPHYPVVQVYRYDVLGEANRSGVLVSQTSGYHVDVTMAVGIF